MVLPNIEMNPPQVYMCSPSWTLLPPHTIPLGRHSAPAPSIQYPASNLNQSILKEVNPEYSLEGLMLKLKLQYFGHLIRRTDSLEKTLMLGKIEGRREGDDRVWDGWMASPTQCTWIWASSGRWWRTGKPGMLPSTGSQRVGHDWVTEQQNMQAKVMLKILQDRLQQYMIWEILDVQAGFRKDRGLEIKLPTSTRG